MLVHYRTVVSLGRGCQPAHQIRRILNIESAHVFDWIVTTDAGLVQLIASDLQGLFARENFGRGVHDCVIDIRNDTQFLHEFPATADFEEQYALHAPRFEALGERWRALLQSAEPVLFVRQHGWDGDARGAATRLRDTIAARAPRLPFSILYLTPLSADAEWDERGIMGRGLPQPEPYDWKGDDAAWQDLLQQALERPCAMRDPRQ